MHVHVINFNELKREQPPEDSIVITVSKGSGWEKGLSPFILGPCKLYGDLVSKNMENAWQFAKVYKEHLDGDTITDRYWEWAKNGWNDSWAHRYPMGKGAIPEFSLWNGERLDYISARKKIYIPLYRDAVKDTFAFKILKEKYLNFKELNRDLYLVDYDGYMHRKTTKLMNVSYYDVLFNEKRKMGHAFVLAMMLEEPEMLEGIEK